MNLCSQRAGSWPAAHAVSVCGGIWSRLVVIFVLVSTAGAVAENPEGPEERRPTRAPTQQGSHPSTALPKETGIQRRPPDGTRTLLVRGPWKRTNWHWPCSVLGVKKKANIGVSYITVKLASFPGGAAQGCRFNNTAGGAVRWRSHLSFG